MPRDALRDSERTCQPKLFPSAVSGWPALQLWKGQDGLHHLAELAGTAQVQAMISTDKESLFFGDMRHFTPQSCSFLDFLSASDSLVSPGTPPETVHPAQSLHDCQAYLAQASLDPRHPLAALRQDFDLPQLISHVDVTHTNLWMSIRGSRSSLHYDPYHNLLCLVQGKKTVKLLSPEVTDQLYPFSVLGESPNHSHVNFAHPDHQQHPLYKQALQSEQEFILQAGDALFIPEGWWHQVDSQDTTIAVNFWWQSAFTKNLQPHMHQYYLRRLLDHLLDAERQKALASVLPHPDLKVLFQHSSDSAPSQSQSEGMSASTTDDSSNSQTAVESAPTSEATRPSLQQNWHAQISAPHGSQCGTDPDAKASHTVTSTSHAQPGVETLQASSDSRPCKKRKASSVNPEASAEQSSHKKGAASHVASTDCDLANPGKQHSHVRVTDSAIDTTSAAEVLVADKAPEEAHDCVSEEPGRVYLAAMQLLASAVADGLDRTPAEQLLIGLQDPVTCILASLSPQDVQSVLSLMTQHVPRTLEAMLLHALAPAAAELLTQKLEQADAQATAAGCASQQQFYTDLYGVTDDPQKALHALLDQKEAFSQQICRCLMSRLLGMECSFPRPAS